MRYFFDILEKGDALRDLIGQEFGTRARMLTEAAKVLAEIAYDHIRTTGEDDLMLHVAIRTDEHTVVAQKRLTIEKV